jgi:hypothetical protein
VRGREEHEDRDKDGGEDKGEIVKGSEERLRIRGNQRVEEREGTLYFGYLLVHCHGHSCRPSALSHLTQSTPDYPLRKVPMLAWFLALTPTASESTPIFVLSSLSANRPFILATSILCWSFLLSENRYKDTSALERTPGAPVDRPFRRLESLETGTLLVPVDQAKPSISLLVMAATITNWS